MKKLGKVAVTLLLLFALVLSFASCDQINYKDFINGLFSRKVVYGENTIVEPGGYTGGLHLMKTDYAYTEIHWVETIEEALVAVEHLKAAGNNIGGFYLSSYETDKIDAKYVFLIDLRGSEELKDGEKWYDRRQCSRVQVRYYGILDDVTIEELEYTKINYYEHIYYYMRGNTDISEIENLSYACLRCNYEENNRLYEMLEAYHTNGLWYELFYATKNSRVIGEFYYSITKDYPETLHGSFHEEFLNSLVYIED